MMTLRLICTLISLLVLGGCAGNALRLEGAEAVSKSADAFVEKADAALEDAKARRALANATMVASDPTCEPLERINVYVPSAGNGRRARNVPLCARGSSRKLGYELESIDLRPIPEEALKPTMLLIGAVGDYGAALAKITQRPKTDISKELAGILAKATEARELVDGVLGLQIPGIDTVLQQQQRNAAVALIQFANNLAEEQKKVDDVSKVVAARGAKVEAILPQLDTQLSIWVEDYATGDAQTVENNLMRAYRAGRTSWDFDRRLTFVETINKSRSEVAAYPVRMSTLRKALRQFASSQSELRRLLAGGFTPEERRRIARVEQSRMLEALGLMARAVTAFGGL
jgi:hypothetical protein